MNFKVCDVSAAMDQMLEVFMTNGMGLHAAFKEKDVKGCGNLKASIFKDVLRELSPGLTLEDREMVALRFKGPNTKEIDYEGLMTYLYKKTFRTNPKSSPMTNIMDLCPDKNNVEQHLLNVPVATVKAMDKCRTKPGLGNERIVEILTPPPKISGTETPRIERAATVHTPTSPPVDRIQDKETPLFNITPPLPPIQETLDRFSILIKDKRDQIEALMQEHDPSLAGVIPRCVFSQVLHSFTEIKLSRSERKIIYNSFSRSGCIAYGEFLNHFTPRASQATNIMPAAEVDRNSPKRSGRMAVDPR